MVSLAMMMLGARRWHTPNSEQVQMQDVLVIDRSTGVPCLIPTFLHNCPRLDTNCSH